MVDDENVLKSGREKPEYKAEKDEFYEEFIKSQQQVRDEYKYLNSLMKIALDELNHKFSR